MSVFDRNDRHGGLLMYGIPNMKLDKTIVQRRLDLLTAEGITFISNTNVGKSVNALEMRSRFNAMVICTGIFEF